MDIATLRTFLEVARKLSFAAVAQDQGINPSSVSRSIAQLEENLGVRLLQRTTRTMTLTEAGEAYYRRVEALVEGLDEAADFARLDNARPTGTLKLTASVAFGERVIVPLVAEFRALFPEVKLELMFTDANVDLVGTGIDFAIRLGPPLSGDVVATRLFNTHYRVVATDEYVNANSSIDHPRDLADHDCTLFALPDYRSEWRYRKRAAKNRGTTGTIVVSGSTVVSSALSVRSVAISGGGPALLADWMIDQDIDNGTLIDVLPDYDFTATTFDTAAWIIYPTRSFLPQKVRVAIDFLKEHLSSQ